jgi:hypothetical protein
MIVNKAHKKQVLIYLKLIGMKPSTRFHKYDDEFYPPLIPLPRRDWLQIPSSGGV